MRSISPLRYPGGKAAFASLLTSIRKLNRLGDRRVVEPYAGGAGASLVLLASEETESIHINDLDQAICDLWWTILNRPAPLLQLIKSTPISVDEWRRQRETYLAKSRVSRLRRAFATLYLNRCNRSGIIQNGGPIGGVAQSGHWKIDARFNRDELIRRCEYVGAMKERIHLSNLDGIDLLSDPALRRSFFFIDPPYYQKGATLYLNSLSPDYHCRLAATLREMSADAWVLTYDDCDEVRRMYDGWSQIRPFSLRYTASRRRLGNELVIVPKWMRLPKVQVSQSLVW